MFPDPTTLGATRVAELGDAALFSISIPVSILGIVVAVWRFIIYYINLVIGGFVSLKILKNVVFFRDSNN